MLDESCEPKNLYYRYKTFTTTTTAVRRNKGEGNAGLRPATPPHDKFLFPGAKHKQLHNIRKGPSLNYLSEQIPVINSIENFVCI